MLKITHKPGKPFYSFINFAYKMQHFCILLLVYELTDSPLASVFAVAMNMVESCKNISEPAATKSDKVGSNSVQCY